MRPLSITRQGRHAALAAGALVAMSFLPTPLDAVEKTLQNDSFTGVGNLYCETGFVIEEIGAARFTAEPGDYPFTVERIQVLLCPDGPPVDLVVKVWNDDGSSVNPGTLLWEEIVTLLRRPASSTRSTCRHRHTHLLRLGPSGIEFFFAGSPPGLARMTSTGAHRSAYLRDRAGTGLVLRRAVRGLR
jgi:hypothetical protein